MAASSAAAPISRCKYVFAIIPHVLANRVAEHRLVQESHTCPVARDRLPIFRDEISFNVKPGHSEKS